MISLDSVVKGFKMFRSGLKSVDTAPLPESEGVTPDVYEYAHYFIFLEAPGAATAEIQPQLWAEYANKYVDWDDPIEFSAAGEKFGTLFPMGRKFTFRLAAITGTNAKVRIDIAGYGLKQ